jgi:hypothetical protein
MAVFKKKLNFPFSAVLQTNLNSHIKKRPTVDA